MKYDVVVVGAGVMGSSAAYYLSKGGKKVLLVDQFKVKNDLNSSYDFSRAFRYEYGREEFYTNLAVESLELWRSVEKEAGKQLYFPCGSLLLGETDDSYAMKSYETLKKLGHEVTLMDNEKLKAEFPQFRARYAVLDHNGGVLEANTAVTVFVELAKQNGADVIEEKKVESIKEDKVFFENGDRVECSQIIVTAGAWVNDLLAEKLPIQPMKQELVYFKPKDLTRFQKDVFPCFAYLDKGFYGFPVHGIDAVKVSNHQPGEVVNPHTVDRTVSEQFVDECRDFFREFVPELENAEVVKNKGLSLQHDIK